MQDWQAEVVDASGSGTLAPAMPALATPNIPDERERRGGPSRQTDLDPWDQRLRPGWDPHETPEEATGNAPAAYTESAYWRQSRAEKIGGEGTALPPGRLCGARSPRVYPGSAF